MMADRGAGFGARGRETGAKDFDGPIGRLVGAEEVANAIAYLAIPLSGWTTGTVLGVDGGMVALRLPR